MTNTQSTRKIRAYRLCRGSRVVLRNGDVITVASTFRPAEGMIGFTARGERGIFKHPVNEFVTITADSPRNA